MKSTRYLMIGKMYCRSICPVLINCVTLKFVCRVRKNVCINKFFASPINLNDETRCTCYAHQSKALLNRDDDIQICKGFTIV